MKKKFFYSLFIIGVLLIVGSVFLAVFYFINVESRIEENYKITEKLKQLMPNSYFGSFTEKDYSPMPMQEVDNLNFVGIVEVPLHDSLLPIYAEWDSDSAMDFPCKYSGSVYNKTLIIGGNNSKGQFAFSETISFGDSVIITDTVGARFPFMVSDIKKIDEITTEYFSEHQSDLIIFIKNTYNLEYTVIFCKLFSET